MGKDSPAAPPAPDYVGAAQQTAAGDLEAVRAQTAANRVNQYTPYGNLTYSQAPGYGPDGGWSATQTLSPAQQQLLDQQNRTSMGLSQLADRGLGYVAQALGNNISESGLSGVSEINPNSNSALAGEAAMMARFQPQMDQSRKALDAQLANQGITLGSEAYDNAMRTQGQAENDLRTQAVLKGIDVGNTEITQKMALQRQQMDRQNQQLSLRTALQNQPINMLNAVRTGSQVTNPQFTNVPQQGQTSGANMTGAAAGQNQYNMGLYNSEVAGNNSQTGAVVGLASAAALAF